MEEITNYRKQLMEMQIKLNNKDRLNLEQRNIVLEKQIRIEQLEQELHEMKKKHVEPHQEFFNANIKPKEEIILEKKECGECRREDRRMYCTPNYKCENDFCCNYK
jgi:hypothetical protein